MFLEVVRSFLAPISSEVTLNTKYAGYVKKATDESPDDMRNIYVHHLGIGDKLAWYGEPDARVRVGTAHQSAKNSETDVIDLTLDEESDGESVVVEGKKKLCCSSLPQGIATAIVCSFTEHTNHPNLNSMIPTVMINGKQFIVILYDCVTDILLV